MRIELLQPRDPDTLWQVAVEGEVAVAFSGPDAARRAQHCYLELKARLTPSDVDDEQPTVVSP